MHQPLPSIHRENSHSFAVYCAWNHDRRARRSGAEHANRTPSVSVAPRDSALLTEVPSRASRAVPGKCQVIGKRNEGCPFHLHPVAEATRSKVKPCRIARRSKTFNVLSFSGPSGQTLSFHKHRGSTAHVCEPPPLGAGPPPGP